MVKTISLAMEKWKTWIYSSKPEVSRQSFFLAIFWGWKFFWFIYFSANKENYLMQTGFFTPVPVPCCYGNYHHLFQFMPSGVIIRQKKNLRKFKNGDFINNMTHEDSKLPFLPLALAIEALHGPWPCWGKDYVGRGTWSIIKDENSRLGQ